MADEACFGRDLPIGGWKFSACEKELWSEQMTVSP